MEANEQDRSGPIPPGTKEPLRLESVMQKNIVRADADTTVGEAMTICFQHRIRHLPVLNSQGRLVGIVTDRDLRFYISHRLGTIMENNTDRETLHRHLHVIMVRRVVTGTPDMTVADAARLMVDYHVGCLPVVDAENHLLGIMTAGDFLRLIADGKLAASLEQAD
jgi:acetoin utilization protein AcuB